MTIKREPAREISRGLLDSNPQTYSAAKAVRGGVSIASKSNPTRLSAPTAWTKRSVNMLPDCSTAGLCKSAILRRIPLLPTRTHRPQRTRSPTRRRTVS